MRLVLEGRRPVEFYSRVGANTPSAEEVVAWMERVFAAALKASAEEGVGGYA